MANVYELLEQIRTAIYGGDVRESIHDAIEQCYEDATGSPSSIASLVQKFIGTGTIVSASQLQEVELTSNPIELCPIELEAGTWMIVIDYDTEVTANSNTGVVDYAIVVRAALTNTNVFRKSIEPSQTTTVYDSENFTCIINLENDAEVLLLVRKNNENGSIILDNITIKAIQIVGDSDDTPVVDNKELAVDSNDYLYLT